MTTPSPNIQFHAHKELIFIVKITFLKTTLTGVQSHQGIHWCEVSYEVEKHLKRKEW